jgi:hypothetical protein
MDSGHTLRPLWISHQLFDVPRRNNMTLSLASLDRCSKVVESVPGGSLFGSPRAI